MAILPILEVPDPRLRRISQPVAEVTDAIRTLIADMFETMYAAPGIGLAAAQVDVPLRLLVMDLGDGPPDAEGKPTANPRVFINPEILDPSDEGRIYNEGCLSRGRRRSARAGWTRRAQGMRNCSTACSLPASSTRWTI